MSLKNKIQTASLQILGVNIRPQDKQWAEVTVLERAFSSDTILTAFENWANMQKDRDKLMPYPLSEFVLVAPNMVGRIVREDITPADEAALDDLCSELYLIGGPAFSGKTREALAALLKTYGADEIKSAYAEFTVALDDFDLKQAPKKFAEGGGKAVLLAIKKKRDLIQQQQDLIERTKKVMLEQNAARPSVEDESTPELPEA